MSEAKWEWPSPAVYQHDTSIQLLDSVRSLFRDKLGIVMPEYQLDSPEGNKHAHGAKGGIDSAMAPFFLPKGTQRPIYADCNTSEQVKQIQELYENRLRELCQQIDRLRERNGNLDSSILESLENYANTVDRCLRVYQTWIGRDSKKLSVTEPSGFQAIVQGTITRNIGDYIIKSLLNTIREQIKNKSHEIYALVLKRVNTFLSENGVYTREIHSGEFWTDAAKDIQPEVVCETSDSRKSDTIKEVRRYPYYFTDETKLMDGLVTIWKKA